MSCYESTGLLGGDMRVMLNSGGHIAGIVNPSNPKSRVLTSDAIRRAPSSGATAQGSMTSPGGKIGRAGWPIAPVHSPKPPRVGSRRHRMRADGPGDYVHG
jgi:polyhydroxyalkanoate synthase